MLKYESLGSDPTEMIGRVVVDLDRLTLRDHAGRELATVPATIQLDWLENLWFINQVVIDRRDLGGVDIGVRADKLGKIELRLRGRFKGQRVNNGDVDYVRTVSKLEPKTRTALHRLWVEHRAEALRERSAA